MTMLFFGLLTLLGTALGAGTVVKEGWLMKRGEYIKNWRPRYYVLYSDGSFLGWKDEPKSTDEWSDPLNDFSVGRARITKESSPKPFGFKMRMFHRTTLVERTFAADTSSDQEDWIVMLTMVSRQVTPTRSAQRTTTLMTSPRELTLAEQVKFTASHKEALMRLVSSGSITLDVALKRLESGRRRLNDKGGVVYENTVTIISDDPDAVPSTEEIAQSATKTASETPGLPEIEVDESSAKSEEVEVVVETDSEGNITIAEDFGGAADGSIDTLDKLRAWCNEGVANCRVCRGIDQDDGTCKTKRAALAKCRNFKENEVCDRIVGCEFVTNTRENKMKCKGNKHGLP